MKVLLLTIGFLLAGSPGLSGRELTPAERIQDRFIAPCCWSQSLAIHDSPEAREMRAEIVALVAAGRTEDQIVDHYVGIHGERILRLPRGQTWVWLNAIPIGVLTLGVAGILLFLTRARKRVSQPA